MAEYIEEITETLILFLRDIQVDVQGSGNGDGSKIKGFIHLSENNDLILTGMDSQNKFILYGNIPKEYDFCKYTRIMFIKEWKFVAYNWIVELKVRNAIKKLASAHSIDTSSAFVSVAPDISFLEPILKLYHFNPETKQYHKLQDVEIGELM